MTNAALLLVVLFAIAEGITKHGSNVSFGFNRSGMRKWTDDYKTLISPKQSKVIVVQCSRFSKLTIQRRSYKSSTEFEQ